MSDRTSIKIVSAALDVQSSGGGKEDILILRGVADPDSLALLKADSYQREIIPAQVAKLKTALRQGVQLPDIELGMRGDTCHQRDGSYYLQDEVYMVDGLQRVTAALELMREIPGFHPRLGVTVYFSTTRDWERERFDALNLKRVRLSPNIVLRNFADDIEVMRVLLRLSGNKEFVLFGRVTWTQQTHRGDLITANTFTRTAGFLHAHLGPGRSSSVPDLVAGLSKIYESVGRNTFLANLKLFYEVIDSAYGIKLVTYRSGAAQLKATFLRALALFFSGHINFWKEERLVVEASIAKKLSSFPIQDPEVVRLAASGDMAARLLFQMLAEHINSGKRTRRLEPRLAYDQLISSGDETDGPSEDTEIEIGDASEDQ